MGAEQQPIHIIITECMFQCGRIKFRYSNEKKNNNFCNLLNWEAVFCFEYDVFGICNRHRMSDGSIVASVCLISP